jgi:hypothetical protein
MKPAPLSYLLIVGVATLMSAILIFRDFDVPILWSTAIGVAAWSWVLLLLWSTEVPAGGSKKVEEKLHRQHRSGHTARR